MPGKLHWKDSYIACYITASSTYPSEAKAWTCNEVTIYCPYPFWTEERSFSWRPIERDESYPFLDYAYDLAFVYMEGGVIREYVSARIQRARHYR